MILTVLYGFCHAAGMVLGEFLALAAKRSASATRISLFMHNLMTNRNTFLQKYSRSDHNSLESNRILRGAEHADRAPIPVTNGRTPRKRRSIASTAVSRSGVRTKARRKHPCPHLQWFFHWHHHYFVPGVGRHLHLSRQRKRRRRAIP